MKFTVRLPVERGPCVQVDADPNCQSLAQALADVAAEHDLNFVEYEVVDSLGKVYNAEIPLKNARVLPGSSLIMQPKGGVRKGELLVRPVSLAELRQQREAMSDVVRVKFNFEAVGKGVVTFTCPRYDTFDDVISGLDRGVDPRVLALTYNGARYDDLSQVSLFSLQVWTPRVFMFSLKEGGIRTADKKKEKKARKLFAGRGKKAGSSATLGSKTAASSASMLVSGGSGRGAASTSSTASGGARSNTGSAPAKVVYLPADATSPGEEEDEGGYADGEVEEADDAQEVLEGGNAAWDDEVDDGGSVGQERAAGSLDGVPSRVPANEPPRKVYSSLSEVLASRGISGAGSHASGGLRADTVAVTHAADPEAGGASAPFQPLVDSSFPADAPAVPGASGAPGAAEPPTHIGTATLAAEDAAPALIVPATVDFAPAAEKQTHAPGTVGYAYQELQEQADALQAQADQYKPSSRTAGNASQHGSPEVSGGANPSPTGSVHHTVAEARGRSVRVPGGTVYNPHPHAHSPAAAEEDEDCKLTPELYLYMQAKRDRWAASMGKTTLVTSEMREYLRRQRQSKASTRRFKITCSSLRVPQVAILSLKADSFTSDVYRQLEMTLAELASGVDPRMVSPQRGAPLAPRAGQWNSGAGAESPQLSPAAAHVSNLLAYCLASDYSLVVGRGGNLQVPRSSEDLWTLTNESSSILDISFLSARDKAAFAELLSLAGLPVTYKGKYLPIQELEWEGEGGDVGERAGPPPPAGASETVASPVTVPPQVAPAAPTASSATDTPPVPTAQIFAPQPLLSRDGETFD